MIKGKFNDEPDYTAAEMLVLARDVWSRLPGTGGIFFEGYDSKWAEEFDKHCFADLLNGLGLIAEESQFQKNGDKIARGVYYEYVDKARELRERHEFGISEFCQERTHTGQYFTLWHFAKACSIKTGECWLSEHVAADHCGVSHDSARRAIKWLVERGWLEIVVPQKQGKRGVYRPIDHAVWVERHGHHQCLMKRRKH